MGWSAGRGARPWGHRLFERAQRGEIPNIECQIRDSLGRLFQIAIDKSIQRRFGHVHLCGQSVVASFRCQGGKLVRNFQRLIFEVGTRLRLVHGYAGGWALLRVGCDIDGIHTGFRAYAACGGRLPTQVPTESIGCLQIVALQASQIADIHEL